MSSHRGNETTTRKGEAARIRVLQTARQLLIDEGYGQFVLRTVADRCGMKLGNLQYYFPTREALLEALIASEAGRDLEAFRAIKAETEDAEEQLRRLTHSLSTAWRSESRGIFAVMSLLALHNDGFADLYQRIYADFYEELSTVVRACAPEQDRRRLLVRVRLITALWDGAQLQVLHGSSSRTFLERIAEQVIRIAKGA